MALWCRPVHEADSLFFGMAVVNEALRLGLDPMNSGRAGSACSDLYQEGSAARAWILERLTNFGTLFAQVS